MPPSSANLNDSELPELPSSRNTADASLSDRSSTSLPNTPYSPNLTPNPATPPTATVRIQPPQLEEPATSMGNQLNRNPNSSAFSPSASSATTTATTPSAARTTGEVHNAGPFRAFTSPSPGVRQLEGAQNPNIEIQKRAPAEVQVGLPATVTLLVRNVGNATAFDVRVSDSVPKGPN